MRQAGVVSNQVLGSRRNARNISVLKHSQDYGGKHQRERSQAPSRAWPAIRSPPATESKNGGYDRRRQAPGIDQSAHQEIVQTETKWEPQDQPANIRAFPRGHGQSCKETYIHEISGQGQGAGPVKPLVRAIPWSDPDHGASQGSQPIADAERERQAEVSITIQAGGGNTGRNGEAVKRQRESEERNYCSQNYGKE